MPPVHKPERGPLLGPGSRANVVRRRIQKRANNVTSLEPGTRAPAPPQRHASPERVVLTLPGTDRPVVRYRVRLHDNHAPPVARTTPRDRSDESPTDQPRRRV